MGLFDRIFHRKKDDEFDFDKLAQQELGNTPGQQPDLLNVPSLGMEEEKSVFDSGMDEDKPLFETTPRGSPPPARFPGAASTRPMSREMPQDAVQNRDRDLELINSKLDTIKALLMSMEQRIANVERSTGSQTPRQQQRLW